MDNKEKPKSNLVIGTERNLLKILGSQAEVDRFIQEMRTKFPEYSEDKLYITALMEVRPSKSLDGEGFFFELVVPALFFCLGIPIFLGVTFVLSLIANAIAPIGGWFPFCAGIALIGGLVIGSGRRRSRSSFGNNVFMGYAFAAIFTLIGNCIITRILPHFLQ